MQAWRRRRAKGEGESEASRSPGRCKGMGIDYTSLITGQIPLHDRGLGGNVPFTDAEAKILVKGHEFIGRTVISQKRMAYSTRLGPVGEET